MEMEKEKEKEKEERGGTKELLKVIILCVLEITVLSGDDFTYTYSKQSLDRGPENFDSQFMFCSFIFLTLWLKNYPLNIISKMHLSKCTSFFRPHLG